MSWKKNELGFIHEEIKGIEFNSQKIKPGYAFIALKGTKVNGSKYCKEALEKGATFCIAESNPDSLPENKIHIVKDSYKTLLEISQKRRKEFKGKIIGITGSVGKTTTKKGITESLKEKYKVETTQGNYNNELGINFSIANFDKNADFWVIEIGTSNPGEIANLAKQVKPDYSIITHITASHIGNFNTLKKIKEEKSEIITHTQIKAFFPNNYWYTKHLEEKANKISFEKFDKIKGKKQIKNGMKQLLKEFKVELKENFENEEGRDGILNLKINSKEITIINSSYNANPASVIDALEDLNQLKKDKTIAILGDMLELGKNSKRYHEALSCYIKNEAMIIGKEMKHLKNKKEEYKHYEEINEDFKKDLNKKLNNNKKETIGILIKGSVRMKMHQAVDYLKSLAL